MMAKFACWIDNNRPGWLVSKHPRGSSGGSVVATATGSAPLAFCIETQGPTSCPTSFAALFALKASPGLISRNAISPSSKFDGPGMFAKSAWYIAALLTAVAGPEFMDPITNEASPHMLDDCTGSVSSEWRGWRLGIVDGKWFWSLYDDEADNLEVGRCSIMAFVLSITWES